MQKCFICIFLEILFILLKCLNGLSTPITKYLFCKQLGSMQMTFAYHFFYFFFSVSGQSTAGSHFHQAAWQHCIPSGLLGEKPRGCV